MMRLINNFISDVKCALLGFCILCNNICCLELNLLKVVNMSIEQTY